MILAALLAITVEVGPNEPKCVQRAAESLRGDLTAVCPDHTNDTRRIIIRTVGPDVLGGPRGPESSIRTYSDGVWTITGSDPRGTVYGIYQVSEELGVSPFYWWDDIPKGRAAGDVSPYQAPVGSDVPGGPEELYADGAAYAARIAGRLQLKTPDPYLNAIGPALALAENGAWDDVFGCYMHGAIGWRMPLNGWRGGYLADLLGDHARARTLFDNYLASMVTNVPCSKMPEQDAELHTADIDYVYRKVNGKDTFDIKAHYPAPAKVIIEPHPVVDATEVASTVDAALAASPRPAYGLPIPETRRSAHYTTVDISSVTNAVAADLYADNKYLSPAWPYTTLKLPASGLGDWCVPNAKAHRNNHEGDMKRNKEQDMQEAGFRIDSDAPIAFTSLYDNYPDSVTVPVDATKVASTVDAALAASPVKGSSLRLELVASTYHMQYGVTNGVVIASYTDGSQSVFPLILPETLAPSNAKLVDTWQMPCRTANRERGRVGNAYTDIVYMPIDPKKELQRVTLETWSNETVIGLKSLAIGRDL